MPFPSSLSTSYSFQISNQTFRKDPMGFEWTVGPTSYKMVTFVYAVRFSIKNKILKAKNVRLYAKIFLTYGDRVEQ